MQYQLEVRTMIAPSSISPASARQAGAMCRSVYYSTSKVEEVTGLPLNTPFSLIMTRAENKVFSDYARFWASLRGPDPSEAIAESAAKRLAQRFVSGVGSRRMY